MPPSIGLEATRSGNLCGDAERPGVGTLWSGATFRAKVLPVASEVLPKGSSTSASAAPETTTAAYIVSICASARRRGGGGGGLSDAMSCSELACACCSISTTVLHPEPSEECKNVHEEPLQRAHFTIHKDLTTHGKFMIYSAIQWTRGNTG